MKRGIDDTSECDTMATLTAQTVAASQQQAQQQQQQQQQQLHNANSNSNSTSSTSPLSNSSTNSSSCLTTNSFSSPSSYSPIQQQQQQQQLQQQQQQTATVAHLYTTANGMGANGQIILTIPVQHQSHAQGQPPMNNLVSIASNNGAPVTNIQTVGENGTPGGGGGGGSYVGVINTCSSPNLIYNSNKPEAKKVKIQKSQPSKVVHVRNIPQQITEVEIIQFGLIFGNIINVLNLRSKCQAFLEFEKCEEAQSMINYFANNPISVAGRQIFAQYSNYKNLVTDPSNTNNQVAKAALDLAKELHRAAQSGGQNTVLRAMIQNMLYPVTLDTIYQIFNRFGPVLKIITFTKNDKFQALIQMKDANCAQAAKTTLHGQNIYNSCCNLHIDYSKLNTLNVKYNNEKSRDYTNPLLPAGDCPDHLALGPGGVIQPIQLTMAAAAAAAAGYGSPFTTTLPAGYHLAPAGNPFIPFGKYLHQQHLIGAPTLLQPASNLTSQLATASNQAYTSVSAASQASGAGGAATLNSHQAALAAAVAAGLTTYSINPHSIAANSNANPSLNHHHHHHHQQQQQQQQHQQHQQQTQNSLSNANASQAATLVNGGGANSANGSAALQQNTANPHVQSQTAPMLIPFLSNLNEDVHLVYRTFY